MEGLDKITEIDKNGAIITKYAIRPNTKAFEALPVEVLKKLKQQMLEKEMFEHIKHIDTLIQSKER